MALARSKDYFEVLIILDKINISEIKNKDLVIPKDELYVYRHVFEDIHRGLAPVKPSRSSNDCTFANSRLG